MSNKYRVAIAIEATKPLLELVQENLDKANYAHNAKRSRVGSIRAEFIKLLGSLYKDSGFNTMHDLFIAMACGNYSINSKIWRKFINGVCNVVNFSDMPTEHDCTEIYGLLCADFEASNPHVTTEMRAMQESVYTERTAPKADETAEETGEAVSEISETDEVAISATV